MSERLLDKYAPREFGGDYDEHDATKFRGNNEHVEAFLIRHPGEWFTKEEIRIGAELPIGTEIRARCNDLRAKYTVGCKKIDGLYKYRLTMKEE